MYNAHRTMKQETRLQAFTLDEREKAILLEMLRAKLEQHPKVCFAFVYGSFLEEDSFHDIDMAVYLDEAVEDPINTLLKLWEALASRVEYPLDVCLLNGTPLAFRYSVTQGQLLFARDEERAYRFIERTWDEFFDFQSLMARYIEELAHA